MIKWVNWYAVPCFLLFAFMIFMLTYQPETNFSAKCIKVFDCKRIIIWRNNPCFFNRMKIRLNDVQCPERNTKKGMQARQYVRNQIYGKIIEIEIVKRRFWGWSDAIIYCNDTYINKAINTKWRK
jgi:hypothetical protein